jgi:hypothetical protein
MDDVLEPSNSETTLNLWRLLESGVVTPHISQCAVVSYQEIDIPCTPAATSQPISFPFPSRNCICVNVDQQPLSPFPLCGKFSVYVLGLHGGKSSVEKEEDSLQQHNQLPSIASG